MEVHSPELGTGYLGEGVTTAIYCSFWALHWGILIVHSVCFLQWLVSPGLNSYLPSYPPAPPLLISPTKPSYLRHAHRTPFGQLLHPSSVVSKTPIIPLAFLSSERLHIPPHDIKLSFQAYRRAHATGHSVLLGFKCGKVSWMTTCHSGVAPDHGGVRQQCRTWRGGTLRSRGLCVFLHSPRGHTTPPVLHVAAKGECRVRFEIKDGNGSGNVDIIQA